MKESTSTSDAIGDGLTKPGLISRIADEIDQASQDCLKLQIASSVILEKAANSDVISEFHMLQDLDRLHQTLQDLAKLVHKLSEHVELPSTEAELETILTLQSLRSRLFGSDEADTISPGHISWF